MQDVADIVADEHEAQILEQIEAVLHGCTPDELAVIRRRVKDYTRMFGHLETARDSELAENWTEGAYPYRNLLSRKTYERQKYRLQVELLKLQAWVKKNGEKVIILCEGRDATANR